MKINCVSCGHSMNLDNAYDDFEGPVRCYVCGSLLEIRTVEAKLRGIKLAQSLTQGACNRDPSNMPSAGA
ncbi:MAG: hypothetical protein AB1733_16600 [Thermodesulfobacteriota bacterium]